MKLFAIRDDDTCFFTDIAKLTTVHGPLFEKDIPLNLAVIPYVSANVKLHHPRLRGEYEPFIPNAFQGRDERFNVGDNKALVDFIRRTPCIRVAQHGYSHAYVDGGREFELSDRVKMAQMADHGLEIIAKTFGSRPTFFVAPWDRISRPAYAVLAKRFQGISTSWLTKYTAPLLWLPKFAMKKFRHRNCMFARRMLVLEHLNCLLGQFSDTRAVHEMVMRNLEMYDAVTFVTHHWEYFREDGSRNEPLLKFYHDLVAEIAERKDVRFANFDDVRRALQCA